MTPGIPVATVAINGAMNAAILAVQMLALGDSSLAETFATYKEGLKELGLMKGNAEDAVREGAHALFLSLIHI